MAATQPELQMVFPCPDCQRTGTRTEEYAGGGTVTAAGGGPLSCLACSGKREVVRRVTVTELRTMLNI